MIGRKRIENFREIQFDINQDIIPQTGLGGINFNMNIKDFEAVLTNQLFDQEIERDYTINLNQKYYFLSLENKGIEITFDLLTGKISTISCAAAYHGKLNHQIGIGTYILDAMKFDETLGFNLDTDFFDRDPFDGFIIYPPAHLRGECIDAAVKGTNYPNFKINRIDLIEIEYAKSIWSDGEITI